MPMPSLSMLTALNTLASRGRRHIYAGTVDDVTVAKNRVANKRARKQRRINRLRGQR